MITLHFRACDVFMFSHWPGRTMEWVKPKHINYQAQKSLFEYQSSGQMITVGMTCNERRGGQGGDKVNRMTEEAIAPEKKKSIHFDHVCSHCNQSLV